MKKQPSDLLEKVDESSKKVFLLPRRVSNSLPVDERKKMDGTFIRIANEYAKHSTCRKLQVGAILVKDNRVISSGYNGAPSGLEHCCDRFTEEDFTRENDHHNWSENYELHAEQNCIAFAARSGVSIDDKCTLYVTTACCIHCAKLVIAAGIKRVVYESGYMKMNDESKQLEVNTKGIDLLLSANVEVFQSGPNMYSEKDIKEIGEKLIAPLVRKCRGSEPSSLESEIIERFGIKELANKQICAEQ